MPFHSDVTMETINDIFPPLDPPLGPDLDTQAFLVSMSAGGGAGGGIVGGVVGVTGGCAGLEGSFPPLSPSSTMAGSMLDDSDDLNTLALGEHPFLEITSGIHIKQEYEDDDDEDNDTRSAAASASVATGPDVETPMPPSTASLVPPAAAAVVASGGLKPDDPSMIRGLLQQPSQLLNGAGRNGSSGSGGVLLAGATANGVLHNGLQIKQEVKEEQDTLMSDAEVAEPEDDDDDDEGEAEEDEDEDEDEEDDLTAASVISSTVSSAISSTVSSAAATPVVSPVQSPAPSSHTHTEKVQVQGRASGNGSAVGQASAPAQNGTWTSGRERRGNRWTNSGAAYSKVEKKELRKRKPTSYALMKEEPLPFKKKRSYNFRQFRRTIEMSFSSEGEKQEFDESLECLKQWANMKTVTQFLQFAMKQLQELRAQGQAFVVEPPPKQRAKKKARRAPPAQNISATEAQDLEVFATCIPSLQHLVNQAHDLGTRRMPCPRLTLAQRDMHVGVLRLENGEESTTWKSSPYLQNTADYVVNYRLAIGMLASGISSQMYERFSQAANFGAVRAPFLTEKCLPGLSAAVGKAVQESTDYAVADTRMRRPTGTEIETHVETSVVNDKRHTTVLAMDTESNQILGSVIITKNEDLSSSNKGSDSKDDDVIGSQKLLRNLMEKGVAIRSKNTGSNNPNSGKLVTNGSSGVGNGQANVSVDEHMIWKAIRDDLKNYSSITSGLQKDMGRTWHPELIDKEDGIRKQLYRSLRFSNGDASLLRRGLCAIPRHYQGSHDLCHVGSPCRQGIVQNANADRIKDIKALQILTVYLQHTNLYRYPTMILEHIKSTNHRQPPKISLRSFCGDGGSLGIPLYNLRTGLYVLWWNENSGVISSHSHASLEHVPTTCHYAHNIWKKFLTKVS